MMRIGKNAFKLVKILASVTNMQRDFAMNYTINYIKMVLKKPSVSAVIQGV